MDSIETSDLVASPRQSMRPVPHRDYVESTVCAFAVLLQQQEIRPVFFNEGDQHITAIYMHSDCIILPQANSRLLKFSQMIPPPKTAMPRPRVVLCFSSPQRYVDLTPAQVISCSGI